MKNLSVFIVCLFLCLLFIPRAAQAQFTEQYAGTIAGVINGSVAWGDYDNDGKLDLLVTGNNNGTRIAKIYHNTGSGFSEIYAGSLTGVEYASAAWGDFDNDGKLDIVLTGYNGSTGVAKIYHNTGSGFSEVYAGTLFGVYFSSVTCGDFDNDGRLDIVVSGYSDFLGPIVQFFRNTGSGFTEVYNSDLPGVYYSSVALGDYDNDGKLDVLLTGTPTTGQISKIFRNTGSGFTEVFSGILPGVQQGSAVWGDYDNDGKLDILITGNGISKIFHNTGSGFTEAYSGTLPNMSECSAAWGDYDNDGKLDILMSGSIGGSDSTYVYHNTGSGFTKAYSTVFPGVYQSTVAWGDYNGDGKLDLIVAGNNTVTDVSKIYQNGTGTANTIPSTPSIISSTAGNDTVAFRWTRSVDTQTPPSGLSYNFRVGTSPSAMDVETPMADLSSGLRRIVQSGRVNGDTAWTMHHLPIGTYYWSVQAVDNAFAGSGFSSEGTFTITPIYNISASSLDFGMVNKSLSKQDTLTISNTGNDTLIISSITKNTTQYSVSPASGNVFPSSSKKFFVTFAPTLLGSLPDTLAFHDNSSGSPHLVPLVGIGVTPVFSPSSANIPFGNVRLGTTLYDTLTVTNTGTATLNITNVTKTKTQYTVSPTNGSIAPSDSMKFVVSFTPSALVTVLDTLTFTDNALNTPQKLPMSATGVQSVFTPSPASLAFGTVIIGTSVLDSVTISNPGTASLNITSIAKNTTQYSVSPPNGIVAPSGSMTFYVTFTPTISGTLLDTLAFTDNASGSPHKVPLSGLAYQQLTVNLQSKWNMVSVPVLPPIKVKITLYPTATSSAFSYYADGYETKDSIDAVRGYWIKFGSAQPITYTGLTISSISINLMAGWNMIGSITTTIPVNSITSNPAGQVTSQFFGYDNGYSSSDSIYPGMGYWVKVSTACQLTLSSPGSALAKSNAGSRIRIVATDEQPPPPPTDQTTSNIIDMPKSYKLEQAFPNPFNPSTMIRYQLPAASQVTLKIYNVLGEEVATLIDEHQDAGYKSVIWNANDSPSGIYFYRLTVRGEKSSYTNLKKVVLIK